MRRQSLINNLICLFTLILIQNVHAYTNHAYVLSNAGNKTSSKNYEHFGVLGQPLIKHISVNKNYKTQIGFIYKAYVNNNNVTKYNISGIINYKGIQSGKLRIAAVNSDDTDMVICLNTIEWLSYTENLTYSLSVPEGNYYITAYIDSSEGISNVCDKWEAYGNYLSEIISIDESNDSKSRNISLNDPDINSNDLPDWWENKYSGIGDTLDDYDEDGYSNINEFKNLTDPTTVNVPYGNGYNPDTDDQGPYQIVKAMAEKIFVSPGESINIDINYTNSNSNSMLSGLGLLIHYDSSKLQFLKFENITEGKVGIPMQKDESIDEDDGDDNTDSVLVIAWSDPFGAKWPDKTLPTKLCNVIFHVNENFKSDEKSIINFTSSSTAIGYKMFGLKSELSVKSCNFDIDGNNTADALTDGLLIIRYLFGLTEGMSLIENAVDKENGTRIKSEDIGKYISQCINSFDVDCNQSIDALSDGLLIIRYLFGLTEGDSLFGDVLPDEIAPPYCSKQIIIENLQNGMP